MTENAQTAAERIKSLIDVTQSLSAVFAKENNLLENKRPNEIAPLQAEKARLAAVYAQTIRNIAHNRSLVEGADAELLEELRAITQTFEARASRQRALLEGARQAAEGVAKAIADEAADAAASGAYKRAKTEKPQAAPVSIDENA